MRANELTVYNSEQDKLQHIAKALKDLSGKTLYYPASGRDITPYTVFAPLGVHVVYGEIDKKLISTLREHGIDARLLDGTKKLPKGFSFDLLYLHDSHPLHPNVLDNLRGEGYCIATSEQHSDYFELLRPLKLYGVLVDKNKPKEQGKPEQHSGYLELLKSIMVEMHGAPVGKNKKPKYFFDTQNLELYETYDEEKIAKLVEEMKRDPTIRIARARIEEKRVYYPTDKELEAILREEILHPHILSAHFKKIGLFYVYRKLAP